MEAWAGNVEAPQQVSLRMTAGELAARKRIVARAWMNGARVARLAREYSKTTTMMARWIREGIDDIKASEGQ